MTGSGEDGAGPPRGPGAAPPAANAYEGRSPFRRRVREPMLRRAFPLTRDLAGYGRPQARKDVLAGMTVAALALPSAMAYAQIAGLPAIVGLYALLLPTVAYALLGSSRQLIVGPEGSLSALVAASILPLAAAGSDEAVALATMLSVLCGAWFAVAWLLRLGWVADYFSRPVIVGYLAGVAVVLVVGQLGKLLGLDITAMGSIPQLAEVGREVDAVDATTVAVGAAALVVLVAIRVWAPRLPGALIVVVAGIVAERLLHLGDHGVALVGAVPSGLPSFGVPSPPLEDTLTLVPTALGLFLVCFADEVLTARAYAGRHGQHVDGRRELLAMGAANAASGLTQGMPVGASGSRTAVNDAMGAHSQVAGLLAAAAVLVVVLFLTGPIGDLPKAVLGAIIVVAAAGLVEPATWHELWRTDRVEAAIAGVTTAGVIVVGVLWAIVIAVLLSILDVVRRSARPHDAVLGWDPRLKRYADVAVHPHATVTPGVVVYRLDDRLFFANASYVQGRVHEALRGAPGTPRWLVLDAEAMSHVDSAGLGALEALIEDLRADGVTLAIARAHEPLRDRLDEAGLTATLGAGRFFGTVHDAVAAAVAAGATTEAEPAP